jgi:mono/diheme cytochrome c family protein
MGKREWTSLLAAVVLAACAGDAADDTATTDDAPAAAPAPAPAEPAGGAMLPEGVTATMVAEGKTLFETGVCQTCHGPTGSGSPLAPNLRDAEWINTDGSYDGIMGIIRQGVPTPKQFPAAMPVMGGGQFTDEQIRALAAFVYSIGHGG